MGGRFQVKFFLADNEGVIKKCKEKLQKWLSYYFFLLSLQAEFSNITFRCDEQIFTYSNTERNAYNVYASCGFVLVKTG